MSNGTFVVACFTDPEKLLPAVRTLNERRDILQWDAVDGDSQLIVKLKPSPSSADLESALTIDGADSLFRLEILSDDMKDDNIDPSLCHSYVFVEVESDKRTAVLESLRENVSVLRYSSVEKGKEIVAFVQGHNFEALGRVVDNTIRTLDGVIRLKTNRVIDLRTM